MELREAEAVWLVDDHEVRGGHVHADFDDGCRHEDVNFAFREPRDDFVAFGLVHLAVDSRYLERGSSRYGASRTCDVVPQFLDNLVDTPGATFFVRTDAACNPVAEVSACGLGTDELLHVVALGGVHEPRLDGLAACGLFLDADDFQIAI